MSAQGKLLPQQDTQSYVSRDAFKSRQHCEYTCSVSLRRIRSLSKTTVLSIVEVTLSSSPEVDLADRWPQTHSAYPCVYQALFKTGLINYMYHAALHRISGDSPFKTTNKQTKNNNNEMASNDEVISTVLHTSRFLLRFVRSYSWTANYAPGRFF